MKAGVFCRAVIDAVDQVGQRDVLGSCAQWVPVRFSMID
jgi:hypothetical protein